MAPRTGTNRLYAISGWSWLVTFSEMLPVPLLPYWTLVVSWVLEVRFRVLPTASCMIFSPRNHMIEPEEVGAAVSQAYTEQDGPKKIVAEKSKRGGRRSLPQSNEIPLFVYFNAREVLGWYGQNSLIIIGKETAVHA